MPVHIDQLGREVKISQPPSRIVSLVPSQTELLYDLGLDAEVVGITKFCLHPGKWFRHKTRVGGTKQINIDKVRALNPDLVIANKEENTKEQIEVIETFAPVWISDVNTVDNALDMIRRIGEITCRQQDAIRLIKEISASFKELKATASLPAAYLIWKDPCMTVGGDTFIHDMMRYAGLQNVFADQFRYPATSIAEVRDKGVQVLVLPSEPFPFKEKDRIEFQQLMPGTRVMLADGEMFSWYGSRMKWAAGYLRELREVVNRES